MSPDQGGMPLGAAAGSFEATQPRKGTTKPSLPLVLTSEAAVVDGGLRGATGSRFELTELPPARVARSFEHIVDSITSAPRHDSADEADEAANNDCLGSSISIEADWERNPHTPGQALLDPVKDSTLRRRVSEVESALQLDGRSDSDSLASDSR